MKNENFVCFFFQPAHLFYCQKRHFQVKQTKSLNNILPARHSHFCPLTLLLSAKSVLLLWTPKELLIVEKQQQHPLFFNVVCCSSFPLTTKNNTIQPVVVHIFPLCAYIIDICICLVRSLLCAYAYMHILST